MKNRKTARRTARNGAHNFSGRIAGVLLLLLTLLVGLDGYRMAALQAQTGGLVVVRSTAPDLRVGSLVREGRPLRLRAGESVELLAASGARLSYRGPFEGVVGGTGEPADRSRLRLIRDAIFGLDEGTRVLGATRMPRRPNGTGDTIAPLPDTGPLDARPEGPAILIELEREGSWCLVDDVPVWLVRADFGRAAATLRKVDTGESADLAWSFFNDTVAWPGSVPRGDGSAYVVSYPDTDTTQRFTLHRITSAASPAGTLISLADRGCTAQVARALAAAGGG